MPPRPRHPQHSTLQPDRLGCTLQQPLLLWPRGTSFNLRVARGYYPIVCICGHDTLSVAPASHLTRTHAPADTVSTAAWRQLRSLRYPDARPCSHYILGIAPCNPLDSERRPQLPLRLRQRSNSSVLCDTLHSDACPSGQYILLSVSQPTLLEECLARTRFGYWSDDRRTSFSNLRQSGQGPQSDGG